jgi:hypothetical protein
MSLTLLAVALVQDYADWVSATGKQSDDALDQMLQTAAEANRKGEVASPEQMKNMLDDFASCY